MYGVWLGYINLDLFVYKRVTRFANTSYEGIFRFGGKIYRQVPWHTICRKPPTEKGSNPGLSLKTSLALARVWSGHFRFFVAPTKTRTHWRALSGLCKKVPHCQMCWSGHFRPRLPIALYTRCKVRQRLKHNGHDAHNFTRSKASTRKYISNELINAPVSYLYNKHKSVLCQRCREAFLHSRAHP